MPAEVRGHVRKLPSGKWQLRYYDRKGGALIDTARQMSARRVRVRPCGSLAGMDPWPWADARASRASTLDRERVNDPMIQLAARVIDEAVGVAGDVKHEHRPFVLGRENGVGPGRSSLDGRLDERAH